MIGDKYFQLYRRGETAKEAIFTRKVGHTQRGGRPILFDRFYAALQGAKAVELLVEGRNNAVSVLQYNTTKGFYVEGYDANRFRDRWGLIHARKMHPSLYDAKMMKPSKLGMDYLMPIFTDAIGEDDMEHMRRTLFAPGKSVAAVSFDQHGCAQTHPLFADGINFFATGQLKKVAFGGGQGIVKAKRIWSLTEKFNREKSFAMNDKLPAQLIAHINVKLALIGSPPVPIEGDAEFTEIVSAMAGQSREKDRLLGHYLCPVDQRIQTFLYDYLQNVPVTKLPTRTFVLDRPGLARILSLPLDRDEFHSTS
jgi:hypothetical protein